MSYIVVFYPSHVTTAAFRTTVSSTRRLHQQLCELVKDQPLGEILAHVPEGGQCEKMYRCYLYDFVRSTHKCTHKQKETVEHEYKVRRRHPHNAM